MGRVGKRLSGQSGVGPAICVRIRGYATVCLAIFLTISDGTVLCPIRKGRKGREPSTSTRSVRCGGDGDGGRVPTTALPRPV